MLSEATVGWLAIIYAERYGHTFYLEQDNDGQHVRMTIAGGVGGIVFCVDSAEFGAGSNQPCAWWEPTDEGWNLSHYASLPAPGVRELKLPLIVRREQDFIVRYNLPGLVHWMLSREEEVDSQHLDQHGRFPAVSSHAFKHGYLERPIVDEWLEILGQVIEKQWPEVSLKKQKFSMKVSHDVDVPSRYGFRHGGRLLKAMAGDLLKQRDVRQAIIGPWIRLNTRKRLHKLDPVNTFEWIMQQSERHNMTSAFYFICGRTDQKRDADYEVEHPAIRHLMRLIYERGHEVGLHPSYNTYCDPEAIVNEAKRLRRVCESENIHQLEWGGRMHFLRWSHPATMVAWDQAGMTYDSTLGFADRPGFRCGTCFEYPAFDPVERRALKLRIRPLIAMECTIMAPRYMGLGNGESALSKFVELKDACRRVNGCFTLLWHNTQLISEKDKLLYEQLLLA